MATIHAACSCGQLHLACDGAPARVSMCHCLACQRRTGSVFATQAWFTPNQIVVTGNASIFARESGSGRRVTYRFCPTCGSTLYWEAEAFPGLIAVAVGTFADPTFPAPQRSVWERRRHAWVSGPDDPSVQHSN